MADIDIPAWITRVQEYVASPPVGAAPLNKSFARTMEVLEATKPTGLDLHSTAASLELVEVLQAYYDAIDAQPAAPAGQGGRRHRKTNRRQTRKRTTKTKKQ
jgi:hypothetical protein